MTLAEQLRALAGDVQTQGVAHLGHFAYINRAAIAAALELADELDRMARSCEVYDTLLDAYRAALGEKP